MFESIRRGCFLNAENQPYPWAFYSHLLAQRILSPQNGGVIKKRLISLEEMRVVSAQKWDELRENCVIFYLIVDETDGVIVDAKFQAFGMSPLIGAADTICEMALRKTYSQARRFTTELVDKVLRDFDHIPAFPVSASVHLTLALEALDMACEKCVDIEIADLPPPSPILTSSEVSGEMPEWDLLSPSERLKCIRDLIEKEVQPYIALDAGGIQVQELKNGKEVIVAYQGACTTCPSSTGATLSAIQEILRARVYPHLVVKPDLSLLNF